MKFRKLAVEVEAFQMTAERREVVEDWPDWLQEAFGKDPGDPGAVWFDMSTGEQMFVTTPNGDVKVGIDDWIIQGVAGELYPCQQEIFEQTYEAVI